MEQRVIHDTVDISTTVNDFRAGAHTFNYETGEYLYIGSLLPFNNLWFELGTPNLVSASATIQIWFGNSWVNAVDVIDRTAGLTASGRISWNTDINKAWDPVQRSFDVTGLEAFNIYDMYWLRMSWDATLTSTMTIKYIGQKFSTDATLASFYPDLSLATIKQAFDASKTTWDEQHYMAAEHIVRDLKKNGTIYSRSQLLDYDMFADASCHKVAEIVYRAMGKPYTELLATARNDYKDAISLKYLNVDVNANGRIDPIERKLNTSFFTR